MIRAENCICGTTTTGTGTLTLKACPIPPGGVDPYAAFTGTGSLGTSQASPMTYTIIEYTDATFSTCKQQEKGIGALLLGANIGATTLARTTPQETATSMNTTTPTYTGGSPTAITIGTAANVLVFIAASATDIPTFSPYFDTFSDNLGVPPLGIVGNVGAGATLNNLFDIYVLFSWTCPMLVKRASARVTQAYAGSTGTPVSSGDARLYAISSAGRPGKLLYDFGAFAGANCLNATGNISTGAAGSGFMLMPGEYFMDLLFSFSGATGSVTTPQIQYYPQLSVTGRVGTLNMIAYPASFATGGVIGAAPDPANTAVYGTSFDSSLMYAFTLKSS